MMKHMKKVLSMMLVVCMLFSLVPIGVSAAGSELDSVLTETENNSDATEAESTDDVVTASITMGTKPADGTTTGQPFSSGTGGSTNFRIPALVTLSDGTLVAAADARWNQKYDACGLDTIVSRKAVNSDTWNYTFANYLGDNGNAYGKYSTAFIDPELAYDSKNNTIYMLVDLYPGGYAINTAPNRPITGSAFTNEGYLKLKTAGASSYDYYLNEGKIYSTSGTAVEGYAVDEYFNLTYNGTDAGNLFFNAESTSDCPVYQVYPTTYLYLTKSTDGGETWSVPSLLKVKEDDEYFYGVGPGRGLVTSDGIIMFSCYEYAGTNETQRSSFIYSKDGVNWNRTENATSSTWSSESQLVELNDGTIRCFFRNGNSQICYVDATGNADSGYTWGNVVQTGISNCSNCQISAMKYSKTIDGKEAILISCPTSTTDRTAGKIFVALVNDDGTLDFNSISATSVYDGTYQYSCLTELQDGSVGLLYENGAASIVYANFEIANLAPGKQIGDPEPGFLDESGTLITNLILDTSSEAKTVTFRGLSDTQTLSAVSSDENVATVAVSGNTLAITPVAAGTATITATVQAASRSVTNGTTYDLTVTVSEADSEYVGTIKKNEGATTYVLDTDGITTGDYLIVYDGYLADYALLNQGNISTGSQSVTISENKVVNVTDDTGILWHFEGDNNSFTIKNATAYVYLNDYDVLGAVSQSCALDGSNGKYTIKGSNQSLRYSAINENFKTTKLGRGSVDASTVSLYRKTVTSGTWSTDLSKLSTQIAVAEVLAESEYTADSWSNLQNALTAAKDFKESEYTTEAEAQSAQNEIDAATQALAEAVKALVPAPKTENVSVCVGKTVSYPVTENVISTQPDANYATAEIVNGKLIITGVAEGTTTMVVGNITYNIKVDERGGSDTATVKVGGSTTVTIPDELNDGETVTWSVSDSTYAGVYSTDGINAKITGRAEGNTDIIATIYDAAGNVVAVYTWNTTVTSGKKANAGNYNVTWNYTCTIYNGTLYYSLDGGPMKLAVVDTTENDGDSEVGTTFTVQEEDKNVAYASINWFVAPNEGYAVTSVGADENSKSQFYAIDKDNLNITYKSTHSGAKLENFLTTEEEKAMIAEGVSLGCDAIFWNSRGSEASPLSKNDSGNGTYVIHCDKLPTVEKTVDYIVDKEGNKEEYHDGMIAKAGDTIWFKVVVTTYNESGTGIAYTDVLLTDTMSAAGNAYFTDDNSTSKDLTDVFESDGTTGKSHVYSVAYELRDADLDTVLSNKVDLSYTYQSSYSSGSYGGSSSADANITAPTFSPKDIVIDFGLPVSIDYSGDEDHGRYNLSSGSANYGTVEVKDNVVTYTPTSALQDVDVVTLINEKNLSYTFNVYPATTVYYEEGFAVTQGFNFVDKRQPNEENTMQKTSVVGSKDHYGYDDKYTKEGNGPSNKTEIVSETKGSTAEFSFTGTGVDIFANCAAGTGNVLAQLFKEDGTPNGTLVKMMTIKTEATGVYGDKVADGAYNSVIASVKGLEHGNYRLKITNTTTDSNPSKPVRLDGFRVYGTLVDEVNNQAYEDDLEENPSFFNLRDAVLTAVNANKGESSADIYAQVFEKIKDTTDANGAFIVNSSEINPELNDKDVEKLYNDGPKKEIYLQKGQALVFKVNTDRKLELGLKAVNTGSVTFEVNESEQKITSDTDMFYEITKSADGTVTITNTSDAILSVTNLKICDDPNVTFAELSEDDFSYALMALGLIEKSKTADATANINLVDYTGEVLATTALTATGEEGTDAIFVAADIQAAASQILPEGYAFVDESSIADQTVTYGESANVNIQVGKVATLTVTYKTLFGKTMATATLTAVQTTSDSSYKFSASEIRKAAPSGYWTGTLISTSVKYGSAGTRTVIGF